MSLLKTGVRLYRQSLKVQTRDEYRKWIREYNKVLPSLFVYLRNEKNKLPVKTTRRIKLLIGKLKASFKKLRRQRKARRDARISSLVWRDVESAFENRIFTGAVVNANHVDPREFLRDARKMVTSRVTSAIEAHNCIKINTTFKVEFILKGTVSVQFLSTRYSELYASSNLSAWYSRNVIEPTLTSIEELQERDSGWAFSRILCLMINVNKYEPMHAGCNVPIPRKLSSKKATINVTCSDANDHACFFRAVVASVYPVSTNVSRESSYPHYSTLLRTNGLQLPMTLEQIPKFERLNDISINVYIWKNEMCKTLHLTSKKRDKHANLLLVQSPSDPSKNHFLCIRNLSRLVSSQRSKHEHKKYFCDRCLHYFSSEIKLNIHTIDCQRLNKSEIRLPKEKDKWLRFKNFLFKERMPFVIYADLECLLDVDLDDGPDKVGCSSELDKRELYQHHRVFNVGYYVHCSYDESLCRYRSYRHESNCIDWFVKELHTLGRHLDSIFRRNIPMKQLTEEQLRNFYEATVCHICEKAFVNGDENNKVRDHCHFTGAYRGPAHKICNLNYQTLFTVPVVFHNLSGYDAHFIIEKLATTFKGKIDLLPLTKENYISFTKYTTEVPQNRTSYNRASNNNECVKFRFIDSFKFLNSSLNELSSYLERDKLQILRKEFPSLDDDDFDLLTRKGVFPYDYLTSYDKLKEDCLPKRGDFYSKLSESDISDADYAHALKVWSRFNVQTLGEYSDLYLKIDVLLLADIFENFRSDCFASYNLDPAHYFTLAGFAWDVMLKYTKAELELLTDIDILMLVERGTRGGLSQCSNRYARANNKYLPSYDRSKPSTYLMYFDVNNLYGWAMSQPLPYRGFQLIEEERRLTDFDVNSIPENGPTGYLLEVDLEYPRDLHNLHADLPFCPIHDKPPGKNQKKLLATLYPKKRYVIHYRYLQQCLRYGLILTKIHRILQFEQSCWLRDYIDLNTQFRKRATSNFQKNLYKLMNNIVFGKTIENKRKHRIVKLVSRWDGRYGAEALIAQPNFHSRTIFSENLVAIELSKLDILMNIPVYVGVSILDISKIRLYEFHYGYMQSRLPGKCKILYTDTDSLIYELECEDAYDEIVKRDIDRFDTSDYAENNRYGIPRENTKVLGLMKDELNGAIMSEFVGLRAKTYAFRVHGDNEEAKRERKKIKSIKKNVTAKRIEFDDYLRCLQGDETRIHQNRIASFRHKVYTIREERLALNPYDDKRFIEPGSSRTLPWGHYAIGDNREED